MDSVQVRVLVPVLALVLDSVQVLVLIPVPVLILVLDSVHDLVLVLVSVLILDSVLVPVLVLVLCSHPRWSFCPSLLSDDDIIFEDFARQRLTAQDDKEEDEEPAESPKLDQR